VAGVRWAPPGGGPAYLLVAGSRRVSRITLPTGSTVDVADRHFLAVPHTQGGPVRAVLDDGTVIGPLPAPDASGRARTARPPVR
jgi:hypothetical protein